MARHTLEKLDEIGGIIEAQLIADLLDTERGMLQLAFGFEDDAVVDDLQGREVGALGDIVGERTGRDMEHLGILLDGVDLAEVLLQQLAEAHETAVGHTGDGELLDGTTRARALDADQEEADEILHVVLVGEGRLERELDAHGLDQNVEMVGLCIGDLVVRQGVVGVEDVVFEEDTLARLLVGHETGVEADDDALAVARPVEGMDLAGSDEEERVVIDGIIDKIDLVDAVAAAKPDDLIIGMGMGLLQTDGGIEKLRHEVQLKLQAGLSVSRNGIVFDFFFPHISSSRFALDRFGAIWTNGRLRICNGKITTFFTSHKEKCANLPFFGLKGP